MFTLADRDDEIVIGVDTHRDFHVAAAVDFRGQILATVEIPTTTAGSKALVVWAKGLGVPERFGVEGTGSYGANLARFLADAGFVVLEVNRPNRQTRRRRGKSDTVDAEAAARAVLGGETAGMAKAQNAEAEMIRTLKVARTSAVKARSQAMNQIKSLLVQSPDELRRSLQGLRQKKTAETCARFRPGTLRNAEATLKFSLRTLGRRWLALHAEVGELDRQIATLVERSAPRLLEIYGVGPETASSLLVSAGDNPERLGSEAAFAALCGVSPVPASSGQRQDRHRLNRGGDRRANNALWTIALVRLSHDQRTKAYAAKRRAEGKSHKEIVRCLKRYIAREIYTCIMAELTPSPAAA